MNLKQTFFQFFPPPRSLQRQTAGISISDQSIRVVRFDTRHRIPRLLSYGEEHISEEILKDGEVKDHDGLKQIILRLKKKYNLREVSLSFPEQKSFIVRMEIPRVPVREVRDVVETQLEEYVPLRIGEAVFDYKILGISGKNCNELDLEVSAVDRSVVEKYAHAFEDTGVSLYCADNEAQAVARTVIARGDARTYMIVDFNESGTGIYIVSNGLVDFSTTVNIGGDMLTDMLSEKLDLSKEEIEEVRSRFDASVLCVNEEQDSAAIMMSFISSLRDEINKHYIYWQTHKDDQTSADDIEKVVVCGSQAMLGGLTEYLSSSIGLPVVVANVWVNIFDLNEYIPAITKRESLRYAAAIGLALPERSLRVDVASQQAGRKRRATKKEKKKTKTKKEKGKVVNNKKKSL